MLDLRATTTSDNPLSTIHMPIPINKHVYVKHNLISDATTVDIMLPFKRFMHVIVFTLHGNDPFVLLSDVIEGANL
jgi:hypothetical protein